jgi:glycosyltransferase involved in cell wall biosynthesis
MKKITVIIPCRNEEKYIADCLDSVINNDYPKDCLEVFVIDGQSSDTTHKIIEEYTKKFGFIHLMINENKTVPYAMNMGIKESSGEYIIRLDAHSVFPNNYFSKLVNWSKKLDADNIGAIWITDVKNKNPKTNAIKTVLSSKFGVGDSFFRIGGIEQAKEVDTVPFGCYKKDVFNKIGLYDYQLTRNQDIELNKRLKKNGGRIFLLPDLFSTYYARETFRGIAKNNFGTGLWNILTVYITRQVTSLSLRHFIPLLFLLSLILPLISMIWIPSLGYIVLISFVLYALTLITVSLKITEKGTTLYHIAWAFLVLHFSYGFGSLLGIFRIDLLFKKR